MSNSMTDLLSSMDKTQERSLDVMERIFQAAQASAVYSAPVQTGAASWYHPGRSGTIALGPKPLAYFGELHPRILAAFDLRGELVPLPSDQSCDFILEAIVPILPFHLALSGRGGSRLWVRQRERRTARAEAVASAPIDGDTHNDLRSAAGSLSGDCFG